MLSGTKRGRLGTTNSSCVVTQNSPVHGKAFMKRSSHYLNIRVSR